MHILTNISQNEGKQTMEFGNRVEYEKHFSCRKLDRETSFRLPLAFFKNLYMS